MPVNTPNVQYTASLSVWDKCQDFYSGAKTVKEAGVKYLPRLDSQTESEYQAYKMRALLFNAMRRTVQGLAGAVFQKAPVTEFPKELDEQLKNVTLTGKTLGTFGLGTLKEILKKGRVGVLIEMQKETPENNGRPYWVQFQAQSIINWDTHNVGGMHHLSRVVLMEKEFVRDDKDEFVMKQITQYRVLSLNLEGQYEQNTYRLNKSGGTEGKWEAVPELKVIPLRNGDPLEFIPFVFIGPTSIEPDIEDAPLEDLAEVNHSHYMTSADYEHALHWLALPTPWAAGLTLPTGTKLNVGAGAYTSPDSNFKMGMLEYSGAGVASLRDRDETKRKMMAALGARLLEDSIASEATLGIMMRANGEQASLKTIAEQLSLALTWCAKVHLWWITAGTDKAEALPVKIALNDDFVATTMTPEELKAIILAYQAGAISFETMYESLQKGELTREGVTAEDEKALIDKEQVLDDARIAAMQEPNPNSDSSSEPNADPSKKGAPNSGKASKN